MISKAKVRHADHSSKLPYLVIPMYGNCPRLFLEMFNLQNGNNERGLAISIHHDEYEKLFFHLTINGYSIKQLNLLADQINEQL